MGGFGSGREAQYDTIEESRLAAWSIGEVVRRHRWGLPESAPCVDVFCKSDLSPRRAVCSVPLTWKTAGYGPRPFFACPHCAKACSILYPLCTLPVGVTPKTEDWGCRKCAELVYASQSRGRHTQARCRYERVAYRLGASLFDFLPLVWESLVEAGWMKPEELEQLPTVPPRPRYMRKARYERLVHQWTLAQAQRQAAQDWYKGGFALLNLKLTEQDRKRWRRSYPASVYPLESYSPSVVAEIVKGREESERELEALVAEWKQAIHTPGVRK